MHYVDRDGRRHIKVGCPVNLAHIVCRISLDPDIVYQNPKHSLHELPLILYILMQSMIEVHSYQLANES